MKSAILFIIFNRPDTTKRVWDALSEAKPPRIYIAADGPRPGRESDKQKCEETRSITENINWDCEVKRLYRDSNLGCGKGISEAISWFFRHEEMGIIIEDDIVPHPDFYDYCDTMLEKYKDDNAIQQIAGHNAFYGGYTSNVSYYKSSLFHMWGWATWRRVWNTYEYDTSKIERNQFEYSLFARDLSIKCKRYWMYVFDMMRNHKADDIWDFQFYFNQIMNKRYSIVSYKNLTRNIGFNQDATHTTKENIKESIHEAQSPFPIVFPNGEDCYDYEADLAFAKNYGWYRYSLLERAARAFKRLF